LYEDVDTYQLAFGEYELETSNSRFRVSIFPQSIGLADVAASMTATVLA